ncbi:hypothetical protein ACFRAE_15380 [Sphingobacterium sp. HJSM2_6]|uniref:hypothetical protein n=1 Tax=Sphingobacterium sp. HJSM2_6 TaxID=3366264 RepID=UPI003BC509DF
MSIKLFITTAILCLSATISFAQQNANPDISLTRKQSLFFEVLGPGVTYSFNYDTRFQKTNNGLGGRIGVSYLGGADDIKVFTVPVVLNYLLGKKGNYFELGAGATFVNVSSDFESGSDVLFLENGNESTVLGTLNFGYRRQPVDGGFTFRAGFSPVFGQGNFIPYWPYIGFGYSF